MLFYLRAYLKNHSRHLYAPLCVIFAPNSVNIARYASFIRHKSPTNCDAHLTESNFQTHSSTKKSFYVHYVRFPLVLSRIFCTNFISGQFPFIQDIFFSENTFFAILMLIHICQNVCMAIKSHTSFHIGK